MISIELNDAEVTRILSRVTASFADMKPLMGEIGERLIFETEQRFHQGLSPEGTPWAPKSEVTAEKYRRKGITVAFKPLFGESGKLHSTLDYHAGADFVEVGSGAIYAAVMQFGAEKGASREKPPIPWGPIPARPFIGISEVDRSNIANAVNDWLRSIVDTSIG